MLQLGTVDNKQKYVYYINTKTAKLFAKSNETKRVLNHQNADPKVPSTNVKCKRAARAEKKTRACSYPPVTSYLLTFPHDKCHGEGRRDAMTPLFRDRCNNSTDGIFITHSSLFQLQFDKIKIRRARVGGVMRHSVLFTSNAELLHMFTGFEHNCQWITFSVFNQWPFNESAFTSSGVNACVFGNRNETFPCLRFSFI